MTSGFESHGNRRRLAAYPKKRDRFSEQLDTVLRTSPIKDRLKKMNGKLTLSPRQDGFGSQAERVASILLRALVIRSPSQTLSALPTRRVFQDLTEDL